MVFIMYVFLFAVFRDFFSNLSIEHQDDLLNRMLIEWIYVIDLVMASSNEFNRVEHACASVIMGQHSIVCAIINCHKHNVMFIKEYLIYSGKHIDVEIYTCI